MHLDCTCALIPALCMIRPLFLSLELGDIYINNDKIINAPNFFAMRSFATRVPGNAGCTT